MTPTRYRAVQASERLADPRDDHSDLDLAEPLVADLERRAVE